MNDNHNKIAHLQSNDPTGVLLNLSKAIDLFRNKQMSAMALVVKRRDGTCWTFTSGFDRMKLLGILEQLKYDILEGQDTVVRNYDKSLDDDDE